MKTQTWFINRAIIRTFLTGVFYLLMPIPAKYYHKIIGDDYIGYVMFGGGVLITGNFILVVRAWFYAFDSDLRKQFNNELTSKGKEK